MQVALDAVGHRFEPNPWLFRQCSAQIGPGELTVITGPSGCGKSTLLSIIGGQMAPTEGTVTREGCEALGWVPQHPYGVRYRSALDHVCLPFLVRGLSREEAEERAHDLLSQVGLGQHSDKKFYQLSGGEAQRLGLARALAARFDLLLIDEPTSQLDPTNAHAVISLLTGHAASGHITVISTHDPRLIEAAPHRIDLLHLGEKASAAHAAS